MVLVGTAVAAAAVAVTAGAAHAVPCPGIFDVNADGRADLPVGTPDEDVGLTVDAGAVTVLLGGPNGTYTGVGSRQIVQDQVGQHSEIADHFGASVVVINWNPGVDSCPDLAIGIPGENDGRGRVVVVMGSARGLDLSRRVVLRQGANGTPDIPEAFDRFGQTMVASGTSRAGTAAALVVGAPGEGVGAARSAGVVHVFGSTPAGTFSRAGRLIRQGAGGVPDRPEQGDLFGSVLTAGGDGSSAVAVIGVPYEDVSGAADAGMVHVFDGRIQRHQFALHQHSPGVPGTNQASDRFGSAIGFVRSCRGPGPALLIGVPGQGFGYMPDAGGVAVVDMQDPTAEGFFIGGYSQEGPDDRFGAAITTLEDEVAIGLPGARVGTAAGAGAVTLLRFGCPSSPSAANFIEVLGAREVTQNSPGVPDAAESGDALGMRLSTAPAGPNGAPGALVATAPWESVRRRAQAGIVHTLPIGADSTVLVGSGQAFTQDSNGVPDTAEAGDRFGSGVR